MKLGVIHHIAVICSDKTAALEFYHEKLGFRIIRENYRPERDDWKIDLEMGDCELELFIMKDHPRRLSPEAYCDRGTVLLSQACDSRTVPLSHPCHTVNHLGAKNTTNSVQKTC